MGVPIPSDPDAMMRDIGRRIRENSRHGHPEYVRRSSTPSPITGSRSGDTVSVLTQLLAALDAAGLIDDTTTG